MMLSLSFCHFIAIPVAGSGWYESNNGIVVRAAEKCMRLKSMLLEIKNNKMYRVNLNVVCTEHAPTFVLLLGY